MSIIISKREEEYRSLSRVPVHKIDKKLVLTYNTRMEIVQSLQEKYLQPEYPGYSRADLKDVEWMWGDPKLRADLARGRLQAGGIGVSDEELKRVIADCLNEAHSIETAARSSSKWVLPEDNDPNPLVVVLSGPGTYYLPTKPDRYEGLPFAYNGDRERSDLSAILGIQLAGARMGIDFREFRDRRILTGFDPVLDVRREQIRQAILDSGVRFLYLGTNEEVEATRRVVNTKSSFVPQQAVTLISDGIDNAYHQAEALKSFLASKSQPARGSICFALPLKAIRFFRMCEGLKSIPQSMQTYVLPMPTTRSGYPDYVRNEIAGVLNYAVQGRCAPNPSPYRVLGS